MTDRGTMLRMLGLDPIEEAVYRRLMTLPSASPADLATTLEMSTGRITPALASMEAKGLVAVSTTGAQHYVASPPAVALGSLLREHQEDLRRAELELESLVEQYRGAAAERTVTDVIDAVTGREAVTQRFGQLQRSADREVLAMIQAQVLAVSAEENVEEDAAVARGVAYRVVVERAVLQTPGFYANAQAAVHRGEQIRVAERLPLRLMVADRQLALVPLESSSVDGSVGALLVHPSGLLDALLALYDFVWAAAAPLAVGPSPASDQDGLDAVDVQVLDLLLAGLTDQAVGNQLGLSLRTVQRRVRHLMERAGVTTRIQLGREAARRGW